MSVRLDKWLWAARFFKTRSKARAAIVGGKVDLNGHRAKPAREVAVGDRLRIVRGDDVFVVEILALDDRRGPAEQARTLYREDPTARAEREERAAERRARAQADGTPGKRPDKRQRRRIIRFQRGS